MRIHRDPPDFVLQLVMRLLLILLATGVATTTATLVVLGDNRGTDAFDLLVFLLNLLGVGLRVRVQPRLAVLERVHDFFFFLLVKLLAEPLVLARAFCR